MNARDLPGIGDSAPPFGACPPNSPDYDERWQAPETIDDDMEELSQWIDTFECAIRARDKHRMQMAKDMADSIMDALILEWKL